MTAVISFGVINVPAIVMVFCNCRGGYVQGMEVRNAANGGISVQRFQVFVNIIQLPSASRTMNKLYRRSWAISAQEFMVRFR